MVSTAMIILGVETTCDETGVGIVENGTKMLSNIISSSSDLHNKYGGVVPEVAAREQVKVIIPALFESLYQSNLKMEDIDAIGVAYGPGLVGSLLIGVETAKTLATVFGKPLIAVNHLLGHLYANWIEPVHSTEIIDHRKEKSTMDNVLRTPNFPLVALIVSGGHTDLVLMRKHGDFKLLGSTRDDAAGEVFDKVARVLGLGYPGGPEIELLARKFEIRNSKFEIKFPRPMINDSNFDFSFSGLKTAVVNLVGQSLYSSNEMRSKKNSFLRLTPVRTITDILKTEIAWEFQNAVVDVLVKKSFAAALKFSVKTIIVGGGVSANSQLRNRMLEEGRKLSVNVSFPKKGLSMDNGAMIASAAFFEKNFVDPLKLQADPSLHF